MLSNQTAFNQHLNKFYELKVVERKRRIADTIEEIARVVFDVLKEVETQEPRFISQLNEVNGRYEGINVISPNEYEVSLDFEKITLVPKVLKSNYVKVFKKKRVLTRMKMCKTHIISYLTYLNNLL